jgi:hypothetical protein
LGKNQNTKVVQMISIGPISKALVGFLSLTLALTAQASTKDLKAVCSAGTSSFDGSSGMLNDVKTHILTPKAPEPSLYKNAPQMSLNAADTIMRQDSSSRLDFVYRYNINQLWPEFDNNGVWKNENKTISLRLDVQVRKVFPNGKIEIVGVASTKKHLDLNEHGLFSKNQSTLNVSIMPVQIYTLAMNHPNKDVKDKDFPHSHFDIFHNAYLRDQIKKGLIPEDEFYDTNVTCTLSY